MSPRALAWDAWDWLKIIKPVDGYNSRRLTSRMFKKSVQQGRSEAHGARNNERHVCARPRAGERAVSETKCPLICTLSFCAMRERSWRPFSAAC